MKQSPSYGPSDFQRDTGVSRETLDRLSAYADLLKLWNPRINLVAASTLPDLWSRHMLDLAQLFDLLPENRRVVLDMGSGAGFPGLVLAALGIPEVHLAESDQRKVAFLREASRIMGIKPTIYGQRLEDLQPFRADVVTARACAPLSQLLEWASPFLDIPSICVFPKGQNVGVELTDAHKMWTMKVDQRPSRTDPAATILVLGEVRRVSSGANSRP